MKLRHEVLAMANIAAEDSGRPMIEAVAVYPDGSAAATDTFALVILGPEKDGDPQDSPTVLVPRELLMRVKGDASSFSPDLAVTWEGGERVCLSEETHDGRRTERSCKPVDGTFPKIAGARVLASLSSPPAAQTFLDVERMRNLCDVLIQMGQTMVSLEVRSEKDPIVLIGRRMYTASETEQIALLMPMRAARDETPSRWLRMLKGGDAEMTTPVECEKDAEPKADPNQPTNTPPVPADAPQVPMSEPAMIQEVDAADVHVRDYESDFGNATQMLYYAMVDAYPNATVPEKLQEIADKLGVRNPYAPQPCCEKECSDKAAESAEGTPE